MSLILHTDAALHEIREKFEEEFPGLRLYFFFDGDENLSLSTPLFHSFSFSKVDELFVDIEEKELEIDASLTLSEMESLMETRWHLPARVYAASGGYLQRSKKIGGSRLHEFQDQPFLVNKAGTSIYRG